MDKVGEKKKRKQKSLWTVEAEELLLTLWALNAQDLATQSNRRNSIIYSKMSEKMKEMGYPYKDCEIRVKIHNLSNKYREESRRVPEGLLSPWPLYDSVHKIKKSIQKIKPNSSDADVIEYLQNQNSYDVSEPEYYYESPKEDFSGTLEETEDTYRESVRDNELSYLKSINNNLELLVQLNKRKQAMNRETNATLNELLIALKDSIVPINNSLHSRSEKKLQFPDLQQHEREYCEDFTDDPLENEYQTNSIDGYVDKKNVKPAFKKLKNNGVIDVKIKKETLKTRQLHRQFMVEKHKLQMDLLRLELQAKKRDILLN